MRVRVERALRRVWSGERATSVRALSAAATPLEGLYRGGVALRNAAYDRGLFQATGAPVPVVSIGNLVVGGTGKTPVSAWVTAELARAGAAPALVSRGYGEDELSLHALWNPDVPVHADPDRVAAARRAAAAGATCVVLDDGFQHRALRRDLDVVLVAAEHAFPGRLLPRGPYREPPGALARADVVIVTRKVATDAERDARAEAVARRAPGALVALVDLVPGAWTDLDGNRADAPGTDVLAVTGIAGPDAFASMVAGVTGGPPELIAFPDHHAFDAGDADRILRASGPRTVVTTEKDAVKLRALRRMLPTIRVLPLEVRPGPGADAFLARARGVAGVEPAGGVGAEETT